jgi:hypothetical protein
MSVASYVSHHTDKHCILAVFSLATGSRNVISRWRIISRPGGQRSLVWFGLVWFGLVCLGLPWFALVCLGLPWFALVCLGLPWFALVWFGLVWFGLVWFGLVWFGLVWFGCLITTPDLRFSSSSPKKWQSGPKNRKEFHLLR